MISRKKFNGLPRPQCLLDGGEKNDAFVMFSEDYSNSETVYSNFKVGGSLNGYVNVLGWTVECAVYTYADAV